MSRTLVPTAESVPEQVTAKLGWHQGVGTAAFQIKMKAGMLQSTKSIKMSRTEFKNRIKQPEALVAQGPGGQQ